MKKNLPTALLSLVLATLAPLPALPAYQESDYATLKERAEAHVRAKSWALARDLYLAADKLDLPPEDARWVDFRLADTRWRSAASTDQPDTTELEVANAALMELLRGRDRREVQDEVWALVHESLGDYFWVRAQDWSNGWSHYYLALDHYARSSDLEHARERYLDIAWRTSEARDDAERFQAWLPGPPLDVAEGVLKLARSDAERARAHYLVARVLWRTRGDVEGRLRVFTELEAALEGGRAQPFYDDALFALAQMHASQGRPQTDEAGNVSYAPDYKAAVALYRRLTEEFRKGQTAYWDEARNQIAEITGTRLTVAAGQTFLPGSKVRLELAWRNLPRVDLALYPVDLTRHVRLTGRDASARDWLHSIDVTARERARSWSEATGDRGDHAPGSKSLVLEGDVAPGAYVVVATGGGQTSRDLVLVSDSALIVQSVDTHALVWLTRGSDGRPVAEAHVHLWERHYTGNDWVWREHDGATDADGLARFTLLPSKNGRELFAATNSESMQAFSQGWTGSDLEPENAWRLYATTDRPAYRPGETVYWKLVARLLNDAKYSVPQGKSLDWLVQDPHGAEVAKGTVRLNAFGSATGEVAPQAAWVLGEYRVSWRTGNDYIGSATLFRLEEYKLPEFQVSVATPEIEGRKQAFKSGESVTLEVTAEYYFGGPVSGATAQVLVFRQPYWPRWERRREFPWYFDQDMGRGRYGYWNDELVTQETRETDADGKIRVTFATDQTPSVDYEYRVEARVTDASRREVSGSGTVRVARQRYFVEARPRHNLHRPGDEVTIDLETQDANGEPVSVEGRVRVSRIRTIEIWTDPAGRRFTDEERNRLPDKGQAAGWMVVERREELDEVLARLVTTDAEGKAAFRFTGERSGAYRIAWGSRDRDGTPVVAETSVFVIDDATTDLAVRHGALDIVLDDDTFAVGDDAAVMLMAPSSERYVLFVQHAGALFDARVVHLTGSVKLLTLPIDERHVPNMYLQAWMVSDHSVWNDAEEVIVPPTKQFLDVSLASGTAELRPGAEDYWVVKTTDRSGEPVSAEVELSLVDEAVLAIQADYAGDPRQFFYGQKRPNRVSFNSSFQQRAFAMLRKDAEGQVQDERRQAGLGGPREEQDGKRGRDSGEKLGRVAGPASPAAGAMAESFDDSFQLKSKSELNFRIDGGGALSAVVVRSDFRTTALWEPLVVTGTDGTARVPVRYPESTTRWRATARVADAASRFGETEGHTRTRLPLMVRLQAPRFFVVGDRCVVSALIDNASEEPLTVRPEITIEGLTRISTPDSLVTIAAGAQARVDWHVMAVEHGDARIVVSARAAELADAMERTLPVHEHGIDKLLAKSAKLTAEELILALDLPRERRAGSTTLDVRVAPSMAVALLDALPYLIEYPYGCVEQTMSRFLPAVITARTLEQLGLAPADVAGRMFGGIEAASAARTHTNKAADLARLDEMVTASVARLVEFQHSDGGWGWWKHGESDHFMTAYVLWGLALAREAKVDVPAGVLERAGQFLAVEIVEAEREPDLQAWMLHALAVHLALADARLDEPHALAAADNLWERRDELNAYSRALFALATHHLGQRERARTLVDNLANGVMIDTKPDDSLVLRGAGSSDPAAQRTAHWGQDGIVNRWSNGSVEATAFCLRALVTIDPQNELVAPVSHWLVRNRRGAQWSNTRDTAISVLALNDYLRGSGELATDLDYELWVNGTRLAQRSVKPADIIAAPSLYRVPAELVRDGKNEVRLVRTRGSGPLYIAAEARFFSLEEPITPAGNELFATRDYVRLCAMPTLLAGTVTEKRLWEEGAAVPSGERIEVIITLEAKNDLEYLVLEDLKPAGLEATQLVSGEPLQIRELKSGAMAHTLATVGRYNEQRDYTGRSRAVHQELRDRKVALFIDKLPQGYWEVRYELRAEVPGEFHALPLMGHAMYVPEIRCNGSEVRFRVVDS